MKQVLRLDEESGRRGTPPAGSVRRIEKEAKV
jgi:hypothetical protein